MEFRPNILGLTSNNFNGLNTQSEFNTYGIKDDIQGIRTLNQLGSHKDFKIALRKIVKSQF